MGAFCLEVTAPKSVSLPTGPSELHRNPICCHWARPDRTETRFAASTAGAPDVFPDVELRSMVELLPVPPGRLPPLEPQRLFGPPTPALLDAGARPTRLLLERGARSSPAEEPISPRTVGVARTLARTSFALAQQRLALSGPGTLRDTGGVAGLARPCRGHRPCTRPTVVGYDRWPVGRGVHRPAEASRRPPTSKAVHIPTTQVQPGASPK